MQLSIVIVNYNVRYFLEQVLLSIEQARQGISLEVFVVDNASQDGSVEMLSTQFPYVSVISNSQNLGFAKANNQAIKKTKGEYILLLNPDTVINEDTLVKCIGFMEEHPNAGGLGVKMIDGSGRFLPESKRGLPTPFVAFCKTFGLSNLFPQSKIFNHYHLGYLDKSKTHEVEVLAGAFMFLRKTVLNEIGLLDEAFFMYGEDIDLSYRILKGGYKNYYYPETTILHYKGESTKKGSLNYVKTFYQAMVIFAKKHFSTRYAGIYIVLINLAIYFRGGLTIIVNFFKKIYLPLLDFIFILLGLYLLKDLWANYYFKNPDYYRDVRTWINFPIYASVWITSIFFSGGYDFPFNLRRLLRGLFVGTIVLAAIYGFLNTSLRFSRALILLGSLFAFFSTFSLRSLIHFVQFQNPFFIKKRIQNILIVGSILECQRVHQLLNNLTVDSEIIGYIAPQQSLIKVEHLSSIENLEDLCTLYKVSELIFCSKDVSNDTIMNWMSKLGSKIRYRIVPKESISIIGSQSKNAEGEVYTLEVQFNIIHPIQKRNKRLLDIFISFLVICLLPLLFFRIPNIKTVLKNSFQIILGKISWVGYAENRDQKLPFLKKGVFSPLDGLENDNLSRELASRLNLIYARDYHLQKDIQIILKNWRFLGK